MGRRMRKNDEIHIVLCCFACIVCLLFGGCVSTGLQGKDYELVSANARNAGRIESTAGSLADCLDRSQERLELVARASERIEDGVSRLEYLLDEYEREVGRLCDEIDRLRAQQERLEKK